MSKILKKYRFIQFMNSAYFYILPLVAGNVFQLMYTFFDTVIVEKILGVTALAGLLRSLGNSKAPLMAMLISSVTNIVLDLLFVVIFKWGIAGAAIATVIAQIIAAVFC